MKKIFLVLCIALITMFVSSASFAVTYDMNSISAGTYSETNFNANFLGVSFNNSGGDSFVLHSASLYPDFSGNAVINSPYSTIGNSTIAIFDTATDYVSVTMGDYNADADDLYLKAYSSNNSLVDSDFYQNPSTSYAGYTLIVSSAMVNIAYVEFYGIGVSNNSVYWDNFSFNETGAPVPEPTTILLLGIGLIGLVGSQRKRFINKK